MNTPFGQGRPGAGPELPFPSAKENEQSEKERIAKENKITAVGMEKLHKENGVWMYGTDTLENHTKMMNELYGDNDNSSLYKH